MDPQKQKIFDLIKKQVHCVLATINSANKPEAAMMGYNSPIISDILQY